MIALLLLASCAALIAYATYRALHTIDAQYERALREVS